MKAIKIIIGAFVLLAIAFGILGKKLPTQMGAGRDIIINKPLPEVFDALTDLRNHGAWSPWDKRDPNMKKEFRGTDKTIGFAYSWSGNEEVGVGEQEIDSIVSNRHVDFILRFKEPMESSGVSYFSVENTPDNQTQVRWMVNTKTPFPSNVICWLFRAQTKLEADMDEGLSNLKRHLESN